MRTRKFRRSHSNGIFSAETERFLELFYDSIMGGADGMPIAPSSSIGGKARSGGRAFPSSMTGRGFGFHGKPTERRLEAYLNECLLFVAWKERHAAQSGESAERVDPVEHEERPAPPSALGIAPTSEIPPEQAHRRRDDLNPVTPRRDELYWRKHEIPRVAKRVAGLVAILMLGLSVGSPAHAALRSTPPVQSTHAHGEPCSSGAGFPGLVG